VSAGSRPSVLDASRGDSRGAAVEVHSANPVVLPSRPTGAARHRDRDYVAIMEAAYQLDTSDQEWLAGLLHAARPTIDGGQGVMAWMYELSASGQWIDIKQAALSGVPDGLWDGFVRAAQAAPADAICRFYVARTCASMSRALGGGQTFLALPNLRAHLHPFRVQDFNIVRCSGPENGGVILTAPAPKLTSFPPLKARVLAQIAVHVASALKLRRSLGASRSRADAVLDLRGHLLHAEGPATGRAARQSLEDGARRVKHCLGPLRDLDPERAVAAWRGLLAGHWSLVLHRDRDGKRLLLAHRNKLPVESPATLSPRNRQVAALAAVGHSQKLIACELRMSEPTVAEHLRQAMAKLGIRSRAELVRTFGGGSSRE